MADYPPVFKDGLYARAEEQCKANESRDFQLGVWALAHALDKSAVLTHVAEAAALGLVLGTTKSDDFKRGVVALAVSLGVDFQAHDNEGVLARVFRLK